MREIKFRAFSTKDNEMYSDEVAKRLLYNDAIGDTIPEYFTLMQYMGIKDRNGTEIYEGDICSGHSYGNGKITWTDFNGGYNYEFSDENVVGIWEVLKDIQVIGNIYQDKNLLK